MSDMDLKGHIAWIGHVYQKFEAMCLEVEEAMCQETVTFVENQVQTVGSNVKRFYSDVMQDLIQPSPMDPMIVAAADLPIEHCTNIGKCKIPKIGMREEVGEANIGRLTEDSKQIANLSRDAAHKPSVKGLFHINNLVRASSGKSINGKWPDLNSRQHYERNVHNKTKRHIKEIAKMGKLLPTGTSGAITAMDKGLSRVSTLSGPSIQSDKALDDQIAVTSGPNLSEFAGQDFDSVEESSNEIENASEDIPDALNDGRASDMITTDMITMAESIRNKETKMRLSFDNLSTRSNGPSMNRHIQPNENADKVIFVSNQGQSDDWTLDMMESSTVVVPDIEKIQEFDPVTVEESCVMVNGAELQFVLHKEAKCKPYKKKIRDVISSKMRSTRKYEYEQLTVLSGDNGGSNQKFGVRPPGLTMEGAKISTTHDIVESEWELL
ncbi:hypothetical protein CFOL_v3_03676 [Cephalotus follicularis]|uniref:Uncharacterized protein n=1 Tax=Cephalotus follicularis TaxID=3775 RepID=A0A1Q3AWW1_CEPFO|nr:hypothetical protein CFOL_v3_03676 [Cephalotus follicularis]